MSVICVNIFGVKAHTIIETKRNEVNYLRITYFIITLMVKRKKTRQRHFLLEEKINDWQFAYVRPFSFHKLLKFMFTYYNQEI